MPDFAKLLSGLFDSLELAIRVVDEEGNLVYVNKAFCTLQGYEKEEIKGLNVVDLLVPEQREEAKALIKKLFDGELSEPLPHYWNLKKKDGSEFMASVSAYILDWGNGEKYQVATIKDVSQILRNQNQAEFQAAVLQSVQDSIIVAGLDGTIFYWNKGAEKLYGLPAEKALGKKIEKLLPKFNVDSLLKSLEEGHQRCLLPLWNYTKPDGTEAWIESHVSIHFDDLHKSAVGLTILCKDITEQYINRKEIKEQRNWLASLLDSQSNYLIRQNSEGFLVYYNKAFSRSFLPDDNTLGKRFQDFIHAQDVPLWFEKVFILNAEGSGKPRLELRMRRGKDEFVWVTWEFVHVYDHNSSFIGIQGVGVEITDRKKAEKHRDELLRKTQILNEELQANEEELRQNLEQTVELNSYIHKSERKFKSMLENSFDSIILYDFHGVILYASPSVEKTLGYLPQEITGLKGMAFIHEDDKAKTIELLGQMMEKPGNRVKIFQRVKRKDGSFIWTESYNTNLLHDEDVQGIVSNFRDVTDRVEAENKLRESEASLNLAQHIARLGSLELDLVSGDAKHSTGYYAIYDYDIQKFPEEKFLGLDYLHPDDVPGLKERYKVKEFGPGWIKNIALLPEDHLQEIESIPFEHRIISAEGRLKYIRVRCRFIRNNRGRPIKSILTIQDISEEKHQERLLDETAKISMIGGWELNLVNNEVSWTPQTYRIFEVPPTENLTVEKAVSYCLPEYQPVLQEAVQELVSQGKPFDLELKMATAKKKEIWVRMMGQGELVNEKVVLAKGTMQNITEKKEAEQEIEKYAERLRLATEAAGIGVWDWDLQNDKMVWDRKLMEIYGFPPDKTEVNYEDFQNALHPEDLEFQNSLLKEIIGGRKTDTEFRIISHPSGQKWIKSYANVFYDFSGKPIRIIGVNLDISWLKEAENTLRANNEELLKTNEELDHFVYSTSHNLRAPLTSILGIVNLMKNHPALTDNSVYIGLIEKSVQKLDDTIQEITNYSRNTRIEVNLEPVDFEMMVQGVVETLSFLERAEKIKISYVSPSNSEFYSDSSRLKMIFTNLISNAIKYTNPDQEDAYIFILIEYKEGGVVIRVKDNGIGIGKEYQHKIFNMFYRASSMSTGSGLGLYIVKEAVQKLGGTIEVESVPGKGTEFIVFLPNQV